MQIALSSSTVDLRELAMKAQNEPVVLQENEQDLAVILSSQEYARLRKADWDDFDEFCTNLSAEAQANGLTEAKLAELLAEIDAEEPR